MIFTKKSVARVGTSRWISDLVLIFLESAEPGEWEKIES